METSVSAVGRFERCPKLWAAGYVWGEWPPQTVDAEAGDELHSEHENFFKKGLKYSDTEMGRLASKATPFLPDRLFDDPVAEEVVNINYGDHVYKKNRIDLSYLAPRGPYVIDYKKAKSRNSWKRYGLKKQTLRSDLAACAYGYYIMKKFGYDFVHLLWLYHCVEEMVVEPVEVTIDLADAKAVLLHHNTSIDAMDSIKKRNLPLVDVNDNGKVACEDFSGCYRAKNSPHVGILKFAPCDVELRERRKKE